MTPIHADDPRLTAWALGELDHLDPEERRAIAAAVARDPGLADLVAEVRDLDATLMGAFSAADATPLTDAQRAAILTPPAAPPLASVTPIRSRRRQVAAGVVALAAAAVLTFVAWPRGEVPAEVPTGVADVTAQIKAVGAPAVAAEEPASERVAAVTSTASPEGEESAGVAAVEGVGAAGVRPESSAAATASLDNNTEERRYRYAANRQASPGTQTGSDPGQPTETTTAGAMPSADRPRPAAEPTDDRSRDLLGDDRFGELSDTAALVMKSAPAHVRRDNAGLSHGLGGEDNDPSGAGRGGVARSGPHAPAGAEALGTLRGVAGGMPGAYVTSDGYIVGPNGVVVTRGYYDVHVITPSGRPYYAPAALPWPFKSVRHQPLSTFSIDVDSASMSHARRYLLGKRRVPSHLVRVEEIVNALKYDDPRPEGDDPLAVHVEVAAAPWAPENTLVRVALTARDVPNGDRPPANLVFLVDTSGSMKGKAKLPLLKEALTRLVEALRDDDKVAIVTYAGRARVALKPTSASDKRTILRALRRLKAGGYTNGGAGLDKAYELAQGAFVRGGTNRVVLATDGEFNAGKTSPWALQQLIQQKARTGVMLSVLGFGRRGYDDRRLEALSHHGDGRYAFIDSLDEAERVLVKELDATLVTVAKDVRMQIELNPAYARGYRLLGYDNRAMAARAFNKEGQDAGELGAGESVVAFYEIIPTSAPPLVDPLKYHPGRAAALPAPPTDETGELMTVKVRWVPTEGGRSRRVDVPVENIVKPAAEVSPGYALSAAAAAFALKLQVFGDPQQRITWGLVAELIQSAGPTSEEAQRLMALVEAAQRVYGGR